MPYTTSRSDGASLYYRDYRPSRNAPFKPHASRETASKPTLVFTAAWPFSSQMYDHVALPLCESYGFRCILIDRRGFGKSEWSGSKPHEISYETFADDLAQVLETSGVGDSFVGIGASLGCGEFLMMLDRHPSLKSNCKGLVFLGPSLPIPMQTARKPTGPPRAFWDALLESLRDDRTARLDTSLEYVWGEKGGEYLSAAEKARYARIAHEADPWALERSVRIFLENDFTDHIREKGKTLDFPLLILHGNADAANPVESGPGLIRDNVPRCEIKTYEDAAHGLYCAHR